MTHQTTEATERVFTGKVSDWDLDVGTELECVRANSNLYSNGKTYSIERNVRGDITLRGALHVKSDFELAEVIEPTFTGKVSWWKLPDGTVLECVESAGQVFTRGLEYPITDNYFLGGYSVVFGTFKVSKKEQITEQPSPEPTFTGEIADWNLPDDTVVECVKAYTPEFTIGKHYTITDRMLDSLVSVSSTFKVIKTYTGKVSDWNLPDGTVIECVHADTSNCKLGQYYTITNNKVGPWPSVSSTFKVNEKLSPPEPEQTYIGKVADWGLPDGTVLECISTEASHFKLGQYYSIKNTKLDSLVWVHSEFRVIEERSPPKSPPERAACKTKGENSGGSCDYYRVTINNPTTEEQQPYTAECNDVIEALDMKYAEANIFKELWRSAAARTLGKQKAGHDAVRGAEKIVFFANRNAINKGVK